MIGAGQPVCCGGSLPENFNNSFVKSLYVLNDNC